MGASLGGHPGHSGILEPEFLSQGLDLVVQVLILGDQSIGHLRAVGHTSDDRDEAVSTQGDGLQNRRLDPLVPATGDGEFWHSLAPSSFLRANLTKPS